jgi:hypothetical protein
MELRSKSTNSRDLDLQPGPIFYVSHAAAITAAVMVGGPAAGCMVAGMLEGARLKTNVRCRKRVVDGIKTFAPNWWTDNDVRAARQHAEEADMAEARWIELRQKATSLHMQEVDASQRECETNPPITVAMDDEGIRRYEMKNTNDKETAMAWESEDRNRRDAKHHEFSMEHQRLRSDTVLAATARVVVGAIVVTVLVCSTWLAAYLLNN